MSEWGRSSETCCNQRQNSSPGDHLEKVVPGHARLARHASWDDDNITARQGLAKLLRAGKSLRRPSVRPCGSSTRSEASSLLQAVTAGEISVLKHLGSGLGVDMADIGSHTGCASNIVEGEISDCRVDLQPPWYQVTAGQ